MKKALLSLLFFTSLTAVHAQNGLENVIVERYYVSDANDSVVTDGISLNPGALPTGSVTYRIYADMLPGYKFQAAYGVPGHELRIETSTLFYNNEDRGATSPTYTKAQAAHNTVMLDSWLSVGAACNGYFGILKADDNGVSTVVNADGALQNADASAGIPLTTQDGLIAGTPEPVTTVGISTEVAVFDAQNDGTNGPVFSTSNGSWASLNGSSGPTSDNRVLIAQITTNGTFSFKLNIQIGTPSGGTENYVAENPVGNEILESFMTYPNINNGVSTLLSETSGMSVYPNPANDRLSVNVSYGKSGSAAYTLTDLSGRTVLAKELGNRPAEFTEHIDLSNLSSGIYVLRLTKEDQVFTSKIVKR